MASEALVVQTVGELMGPDALRAAVNRLKAENAQNMQAAALIMEVVDPASYQNAVNAGRVLQTAQIKATTFFKPIKQEHDRQKQVVLDAERELVAEIEREKRRLAGLITGFEAEQARLRREEQQRHEAQMRKDEEERRLAEAIYLEDQGASREAIDEKLAEEPMPVAIVQPYVTPAKMAGKAHRGVGGEYVCAQ
jgi:phosphopantothenoylcysteine synthetase/decarboxylase